MVNGWGFLLILMVACTWTSRLMVIQVNASVELRNINCSVVDGSFCDFEYCYIKAVNRTYKYLSYKVNLFQVPISNVTVHGQTWKKANGYKPFLFNVTVDFCKFLRNPRNPVVAYFFGIFKEHSNINHTCPYAHDIIVDRLDIFHLDSKLTKILPFPDGDYAFYTGWYAYNKLRASITIFVNLT